MIFKIIKFFGNLVFLTVANFFMFGWMTIQDFLPHAFDPYPYSMLQTVMMIVMFNVDILILMASLKSDEDSKEHTHYLKESMRTSLLELKAQKESILREEKRDALSMDILKEMKKIIEKDYAND